MGEINKFCLVCRRSNKSNEKSNKNSNGKNDDTLLLPPIKKDFREIFSFTGSNSNQCLNKQLWNIFIARRLLQLPQSLCREILQLGNGRKNPSSWFVVCQTCGEILEEAWKLHGQILKLENKLKNVGKRLQNQIRETQQKRKVDKDAATKAEKRGTQVEKRIWRWLMDEEQPYFPTPPATDVVVKREIASPDRSQDNNQWDLSSAELVSKTGNDDPDWNPSEFLKLDEDDNDDIDTRDSSSILIKTELDDEIKDPLSFISSDSSSDSSLSFSDDEDVWEPKQKRKRRGRPPGKRKKVEGDEELGNENEEEEFVQNENDKVSGKRCRRARKSTLVKNSRSKDSVRKAKSSLRSKTHAVSNSGNPSRKCARKARISCNRCPAVFRGDAELAPHVKLHEKCDELGNEFDCKTCGYPSESERSLRQHMSLKHELQKYICDVCGYEAPRKGRLARHKKLHMNMVDAKTYQCDICQEKFNNYIGFTRHQRKEHAEELNINLFKCEKCPSAYTTNKMLQDHILHVHERNSKWCCDICGKGLLSEKNLKEHLETHEHRERSEICWVCGVDFLNNRSLREHVRKFHPNQHNTKYAKAQQPQKEEPEKEYKCLYCTFTSPFRLVVMRHRKTHRDVFRHLCEICSNEYSSLASLVLHKKIAHGDGKTIVQCEWCQKSFAHKHYLQNHIPRCKMRPSDIVLPKTKKPFRDSLLVTPEGTDDNLTAPISEQQTKTEKNFNREIDEFSNSTAQDLTAASTSKRAIKTEKSMAPSSLADDPKSILCKYCKDYKTDNRGKMYDHVMKVHKDELEFKYNCNICDLKYTTKPSLNRHMAIHHSAENMMACTFCQKVFRHWSLLRLHYKHSCKSMPPGAPIPEAPNKRSGGEVKEKKDKPSNKKPKISKFRVPRQRGNKGVALGAGGGVTIGATPKRRKFPRVVDHHHHHQHNQLMYYHQNDGGIGQEDSMEMGLEGGGVGAGLFSEQQSSTPSTSTSPSSFSIMYPHQSSIAAVASAAATGMQGAVDSGSVSAAAAAAMQMFSAYNNSQGGGGGGSSSGATTQRGWW